MKTIKSLKDITTLEVGDVVVFGDLEYKVYELRVSKPTYFLIISEHANSIIFNKLKLNKLKFCSNLGIEVNTNGDFPETKSLEALTALVSALFKEYEKQNELPKTWEEFCERNPIKKGECFINNLSIIEIFDKDDRRDAGFDRNVYISEQEAKAHLALMQLRQLRKAYVKDWEPDWTDSLDKYCINFQEDKFKIMTWGHISQVLSFPTRELAKQFLNNFKDLLEIAKQLL
jgi:hypothetical protein